MKKNRKNKHLLYRRKRIFSAFVSAGILAAALAFGGCGKSSNDVEVALVTDGAGVDDQSFNQAAWEAVEQYAKETQQKDAYYQPEEVSRKGYAAAIEKALKAGAEVVICPGEGFETVVYEYQRENLSTKFILLDGVPHAVDGDVEKLRGNTHAVLFSKTDEGFLAGYVAVKEGYTNLGYIGSLSESSSAKEYGAGFIKGADAAAGELGLTPEQVQLRLTYSERTNAAPALTDQAAAWYAQGVQVLFSDNTSIINCIGKAATAAGTRFISVDQAGSAFSSQRLMNIQANYHTAVYQTLLSLKEDKYQGGEKETIGLQIGAVEPSWSSSGLQTFNQDQYTALVSAIQGGTIVMPENPDGDKLPQVQNLTLSVE